MSVTLDVDDAEIPGLAAAGRPDPAYAERLGLVPAPAGRRSAAFALDAFIWIVLAAPAAVGAALLVDAVLRSGGEVAVIASGGLQQPLVLIAVGQGLVTIFGIVQLALHGRKAITVGKAAFGLRSVNVARFDNPGFWRIVWRSFVLWGAQSVVPLIGPAVLFASSAWDPEHRGRSWLDRVGGCYVIDVRHGLDPLNPKALRPCRRSPRIGGPTATRSFRPLVRVRASSLPRWSGTGRHPPSAGRRPAPTRRPRPGRRRPRRRIHPAVESHQDVRGRSPLCWTSRCGCSSSMMALGSRPHAALESDVHRLQLRRASLRCWSRSSTRAWGSRRRTRNSAWTHPGCGSSTMPRETEPPCGCPTVRFATSRRGTRSACLPARA